MTKVIPVTPDGKRYERRYYSDGRGGKRGEDLDRPTTSGYVPSLRERHTGFSPVRQQVRPSTAGPTSNRENLAVYLERMERILAEVQATHTDLISRRNRRRGSRSDEGGDSNQSSPSPYQKGVRPQEVETVPLDIDEILADASIEEPESPDVSPRRRLRDVLDINSEKNSPVKARARSLGNRERIRSSIKVLERNSRRSREAGAQAAAETRPSTASKRTSALKKLRRVSARKRSSVRQKSCDERTVGGAASNQQKPCRPSPEREGVIAVTSSTFCLNPQASVDLGDRGRDFTPSKLPLDSEGLALEEAEEGTDAEDQERVRQRVLERLNGMDDNLRDALKATLKGTLTRRRLNSKLGRSIVADIKHLRELIDGFGDETSSSSLHNRQLELKMKTQFSRDLNLKKKELLKALSTSQALKPRVLQKPAVPVTPLKRVSKSLRIRNRPDTAPAMSASRKPSLGPGASNQNSGGGGAGGSRKVAWGEKENNGAMREEATKKPDAQPPKPAFGGGETKPVRRNSKGARSSSEGEGEEEAEKSEAPQGNTKKAFLKRKRAKIKMYKIPNYSHVKPLVDSHHDDERDASEPRQYDHPARPATAPALVEKSATPPQQYDSPIDDLKEILGLSHGKESTFFRPRSAAGRKGRRRKANSVNSLTHLSGTVTRLFSSSVQKAKQAIKGFEDGPGVPEEESDGGESARVPRALESLRTSSAAPAAEHVRLGDLMEEPEFLERVKAESEVLDDFVKPNELSFVHLNLIKE
ncbi:hypothetical protein HOP50_05g38760 [Chloropicon primus]|uniref:Uncharacterized protein n=1 Tax=Chloropicon primus TaxID=1764295 RepID=A0A5B8MP37_9CHLO|nr:hypothetical protein A3770_05p38630 [Chloropicon primus]UPR00561.1 hypothetical protein HOP50_05g38760 [Chloropicon primus]|eukprot:QDZ21345.1 hypothetical protein A3770_05p38630 [Chloropicon primus]